MKVTRRQVAVPPRICLECFNAQQQLGFPFLVYCRHNRALALLHNAEESATFECAPEQLDTVIQKLKTHHPAL